MKVTLTTLLLLCLIGCSPNAQEYGVLEIQTELWIMNPTGANPLAARYDVRTSVPCRAKVVVKGQDGEDLEHQFEVYSTQHQIPILVLYQDWDNTVEITLESPDGTKIVCDKSLSIGHVINVPLEFKTLRPELMSDEFTMIHTAQTIGLAGYPGTLPVMIDKFGKIRWVSAFGINHVFKPLNNGHYLVDMIEAKGTQLVEFDLLGVRYTYWPCGPHGVHHDALQMPNGNLLALTSTDTNPDDGVIEIDGQTGAMVRSWDMKTILDPTRPSCPTNNEVGCWLHLNAIVYCPHDDTFVVSGRHQSIVAKIDRKTSKIVWLLGPHDKWSEAFKPYLLTPQGADFEWQWGQHAPFFHPEDPTRLLVYDNGCDKSYDNPVAAANNYSRAVEYQIDERTKTVRQTWQWGKQRGSSLYTPYIGNTVYASNGNVLICFGGITKNLNGEAVETLPDAKNSVCLVEVNPQTNEVAMELMIQNTSPGTWGFRSYRAYKYSLY